MAPAKRASASPLDALLETLKLKALPRAGWVRKGVPQAESVASHSWGVAWLVLVLAPPELDRERCLAYAVLHDLPEVRTGDITPVDGVSKADKAHGEHQAMTALAETLGLPSLGERWNQYEAQADAESRFVRQLDRLDMALQALLQHEEGRAGMAEFVDSADKVIVHPALRPWMDAIRARLDYA